MKKILIFGSILTVVILVLVSSNSVVASKTMDDSTFDRFINGFVKLLQKDDRFKDMDVNEMATILQDLRNSNGNGRWYPGMILWWLFSYILGFFYLISIGEWFPGVIIFSMILYILVSLWSLIIWGPDT